MNRKHFLKSCSIGIISLPFISFGHSPEKRNPLSLFTIEELRLFCEKNNLHYIENNEMWLDKYNQKMITHKGRNFWIYKRWPFLHKNNPNDWYEMIKWNALIWQLEYKHFFLYDIIETTLPFQKDLGEFYSMTCCSKFKTYDKSNKEKMKYAELIKVYCINENCWYKPIVNTDSNEWWYVDRLERV